MVGTTFGTWRFVDWKDPYQVPVTSPSAAKLPGINSYIQETHLKKAANPYGTCAPAVPLLGTYAKEPKTLILKNISSPVFTAALFTIARMWKQPKCPPVDEWVGQVWDIYAMEYHSAIKTRSSYSWQQRG